MFALCRFIHLRLILRLALLTGPPNHNSGLLNADNSATCVFTLRGHISSVFSVVLTPTGAARDCVSVFPYVSRRSSWTHPCSPDKVVYLQFFHVASTQFSAYIYLVPCSALCSWLCQSASRDIFVSLLLQAASFCYHIFLHFQYIEAMHWCAHVSMLMCNLPILIGHAHLGSIKSGSICAVSCDW